MCGTAASTSPCYAAEDRPPIFHDQSNASDNDNLKSQDSASCPKNIDDFLALYRHEDWSIQEFLDCLEDPKPSRNTCTADSNWLQENIPSDSAILAVADANSTVHSSNVSRSFRDSLRVEIRKQQNRKSQQRYREKLKKSALPNAVRGLHPGLHPRKPLLQPQPWIPNPESKSSCQRLHMAMLTILRSRRDVEARIFQR